MRVAVCRHLFVAALLGLAASSAAHAMSAGDLSAVERHYNELHAIEQSDDRTVRERTKAIIKKYEAGFRDRLKEASLRGVSIEDLDLLLKAAYIAAFYTFESRYLSDARAVMYELERRRAVTDNYRETLHRMLVGYRDFTGAQQYAAQHPGLRVDPVPVIGELPESPDSGALVYNVSATSFELMPERVPLDAGATVVVVTHPLCAFSRGAMEDIEQSPELAAAMKDSTLWLAPPSMRLHFDELKQWNEAHPTSQIALAGAALDWPMIADWATPQFFLIKDGRVLDSFSGWPGQEQKERLAKLLSRGGLLK